mgnify:CR=1 FL=1
MNKLAALALLMSPVTGIAQEYNCIPVIKYECTKDQCEKITEDFQDAESFGYNKKTNKISACLWTNCYASKATVFKDKASGTFTAFGKLTPTAHPGNEPIVVSLTIDTSGNFNAVWGYNSQDLTFDLGKCRLSK